MIVLYNKKFLKDLAAIPEIDRLKIEQFVFNEARTIKSFHGLRSEKLQGYKNYYKVRFGNYRVGLKYENNILSFERVLHRKEIYKYFPS
ncbi:MAG: type II toxin-antitoxin system RelE/ParE family toxin [Cyclobacteriaceae bacterium]|nr:type II toxin-antitoxin system RelE/ParE family toxin [Cyclobacteriaceae bacterium]